MDTFPLFQILYVSDTYLEEAPNGMDESWIQNSTLLRTVQNHSPDMVRSFCSAIHLVLT